MEYGLEIYEGTDFTNCSVLGAFPLQDKKTFDFYWELLEGNHTFWFTLKSVYDTYCRVVVNRTCLYYAVKVERRVSFTEEYSSIKIVITDSSLVEHISPEVYEAPERTEEFIYKLMRWEDRLQQ